MAFKRTKSGLIKLVALASTLLPGCVEKVVEHVEVPGPAQQSISEVVALSEDGSVTALKTSFANDIEVSIHKDGQLHNLSRDSKKDNLTLGLMGDKVIAKKVEGIDRERLQIFDENGNEIFKSQEFEYIHESPIALSPEKLMFYAWGNHSGNVFLHNITTKATERMFPEATHSYIEGRLGDTIFLDKYTENGSTTYALKPGTSTFPDGLLIPIGGGQNEYLHFMEGAGTTVLFNKWTPGQDSLMIYDAQTDLTKDLVLPTDRNLGWQFKLSQNGEGLMTKLVTGAPSYDDYEWWYTDTTQATLNPILITAVSPTGNEDFQLDKMSLDGKVIAFQDYASHRAFIFNAKTNWFDDPLEWTAGVEDSYCEGFTADGRAVIKHESDLTYTTQIHLFDPQTQTLTELGDNNDVEFSNQWGTHVTADGKYIAIQARDENTNETVILLENLATGQREDVMRVEESDLALIGGTPDGENILVTPYNWDAPTNLFVYHIPTKEFRQVTDTEKRCWYDFVKSSGDDDVHIIRQYNNNGTNAYLKLDEDKPLAELVGFGK